MAVELQLAASSPRRLGKVLSGYGADRRISAILFEVVNPNIGYAVRSAAARLDNPPIVHIQPAKFDEATAYPVRPNK